VTVPTPITQSAVDRAVKSAARYAGSRVVLRPQIGEIEIILGDSALRDSDPEPPKPKDEFEEWSANGKL